MEPSLPAPQNNNPYDFIMNSGPQPSGKGKLKLPKQPGVPSPAGNDMKKRILIVLGGVTILVLAFVVISSVISNAGKSGVNNLKGLAAEQNELIRVADLGLAKAKSSRAKNLAATASIVTKTLQQRTVKLIGLKNVKLLPAELGAKTNPQSDALLVAAEANNNYDDVLLQILSTQLVAYQQNLRQAYNATQDPVEKQVLQDGFNGISLILSSQPQ